MEAPMAEMKRYTGGCQCGAVRYQVETDLAQVVACKCSRCAKLGALLTFVDADKFAVQSGEAGLTDYQFNKKVIHHLFCRQCGIQSFARGKAPDGTDMVAINVRCLEDVDPSSLTPMPFNGRDI
jgi:hypothetical protein